MLLSLVCVSKGQSVDVVYEEKEGVVVIEAESAILAEKWIQNTTLPDFKGKGFIEWSGEQRMGLTIAHTDAIGIISYKFKIQKPGIYQFLWRTRQYDTAERADAGNDSFVRFASGKTPDGLMDLRDFTKFWVQSKKWSWATTAEPVHAKFDTNVCRYFDAGVHSIEIAARSPCHAIDRFVLFHKDSVKADTEAFEKAEESRKIAP